MAIFINQIGYRPDDYKVALSNRPAKDFQVKNLAGDLVYTGTASLRVADDPASGDTVYQLDFSELQEPGTYYLQVDDDKSSQFEISTNVYNALTKGLLKSFYYQRCGQKLEAKYASHWHHQKCHAQSAIIYGTDKLLDVSGGWHDAGDYGRYIEPGAKAVVDLLRAYEMFPDAFQAELDIPESGNGIPDIINETRYELEWMFRLQDQETGAVYSKVTTSFFPGMIMPEADDNQLYVYPFSTTATADFVGAMAIAARVYRQFDQKFSDRCLAAAKQSFSWLTANTNHQYHSYAGKSLETGTGGYGDRDDRDERYWAAAEMLRTTGDKQYNNYFVELYHHDFPKFNYDWQIVSGYGSYTYLQLDEELVDQDVAKELRQKFINQADQWAKVSQQDGYGSSLKPDDYIWGSNGLVMDRAMHLITSYLITNESKYRTAALANFNYLLGLNPLGYCYVTGFGSNPVMHPHHRPSAADGVDQPVPGMVAGGPNYNLQDNVSKDNLAGEPPAKTFIDHLDSYATNEMTVYWNSPAVFVAGFFTMGES